MKPGTWAFRAGLVVVLLGVLGGGALWRCPPRSWRPGVPAGSRSPGLIELRASEAADGSVSAHWLGSWPGDAGAPPVQFGVEELWFHFKPDGGRLRFRPQGRLYFSDWSFEVFAPDGRHVLLLQDRFGPYHVVATARLRQYLQGAAAPDEVVERRPNVPDGFVPVHGNARWLSPSEFQFDAQGETTETIRHRLHGG